MGGEPEVGVEYGAHHFHGVAAEREVVGNEQGDEASQTRHGAAEADFVNAFQYQTQPAGAPADEDGGGVKVCHRWPAFQHHAVDQPEGVDDKRQRDEIKRGAAQGLGQVRGHAISQQRAAGQDEGEDVNDGRVQEDFDPVEVVLRPALADFLGKLGREPGLVIRHGAVEIRRIVVRVGFGHLRVIADGRVNGAALNRAQQARADVEPGLPIRRRIQGRNDQRIGHVRQGIELLREGGKFAQRVLIHRSARLLGAKRRQAGGERGLVIGNQPGEIMGAGGLEAVFQALVKDDGVAEFQDLLLIGGALRILDLAGLPALRADFTQHRTQFAEGVIAQSGFLDALFAQLELADEFGMVNQKDRAGVGDLRFEEGFEQPIRGSELGRVMPEFPGGNFFQRHVASAADLEQGVARDGVERLDAAIEQHGQAAKFAGAQFAIPFGQHDDDDFRGEQRDEKPRQDFVESFHAVLRFEAKRIRCVMNCSIMPAATITHAKYGVSQLGL